MIKLTHSTIGDVYVNHSLVRYMFWDDDSTCVVFDDDHRLSVVQGPDEIEDLIWAAEHEDEG